MHRPRRILILACWFAIATTAFAADIGNLKIRADQGDTVAQEAIGRYYDGNRQYTDAYNWYLKAAQAGRAESQYRLGLIQLKGKPTLRSGELPVPANPERAIHWLKMAAGQDHAAAQGQLGKCYADGIGVRKDPVEAYKWSLLAAEKMVTYSSQANRMALQLTPDQIRRAKQEASAYLASLPKRQQRTITAQLSGSHKLLDTANSTRIATMPRDDSVSEPSQVHTVPDPSTERPKIVEFIGWLIANIGLPAFVVLLVGAFFAISFMQLLLRTRKKTPKRNTTRAVKKTAPTHLDVRDQQHNATTPSKTPRDALRNIDWFQFEKLMELIYAREGYHVERRGGANPDGGIDLVLVRGIERIAVQCKHWKSRDVGVKAVREFLGAMTAERFESGIFVSTGAVTDDAIAFAGQNRIKLLSRGGINSLMSKHDAAYDPEFRKILDGNEKRCPKCESEMIERVSTRGANIGQTFWGCSTFPRCRYVLPINPRKAEPALVR